MFMSLKVCVDPVLTKKGDSQQVTSMELSLFLVNCSLKRHVSLCCIFLRFQRLCLDVAEKPLWVVLPFW